MMFFLLEKKHFSLSKKIPVLTRGVCWLFVDGGSTIVFQATVNSQLLEALHMLEEAERMLAARRDIK